MGQSLLPPTMRSSTVRRLFVDRVKQKTDYRESPFAPTFWPGDPTTVGHLSFTVDLGQEEVVGGRGSDGSPYLVTLEVEVRFLYRLRPNQGQAETRVDYDDARDELDSLIRWTLHLTQVEGVEVIYQRTPRPQLTTDGAFLAFAPAFRALYYRS